MGSILSAGRHGQVQEVDISANTVYRYPPKSGSYFGSHFIMGGKEFETVTPEAYLFGENVDLNFLPLKPQQFPYKPSGADEPIRALRCLVNVRKDSLRLVKVPSPIMKTHENEADLSPPEIISQADANSRFYNIEFTFDAECPCLVTIYYNATEEINNKSLIYTPETVNDCSATVQFNAGCNQQFCLPSHVIPQSRLSDKKTNWMNDFKRIPIVIQVQAENGPAHVGHSHIVFAEFYKSTETTWSIRAIKQKQAIDGICYLLQEIYGIENKRQHSDQNEDDENNDDLDTSNSECVVCLSEMRDTLILPCKHLCLCSSCANQLRYQQSGCPICRQSFRALLQIRAVRKKTTADNISTTNPSQDSVDEDEAEIESVSHDIPIPEGYEVISLVDTVNGTITESNSANTSSTSLAITSISPSQVTTEVATKLTTVSETKSIHHEDDESESTFSHPGAPAISADEDEMEELQTPAATTVSVGAEESEVISLSSAQSEDGDAGLDSTSVEIINEHENKSVEPVLEDIEDVKEQNEESVNASTIQQTHHEEDDCDVPPSPEDNEPQSEVIV